MDDGGKELFSWDESNYFSQLTPTLYWFLFLKKKTIFNLVISSFHILNHILLTACDLRSIRHYHEFHIFNSVLRLHDSSIS